MRVSEAENHWIDVDGPRAVAKVWRTPHLDSAAGARLAGELARGIERVLPQVKTLVFDVTEGPTVAGPKTTEALGALFASCERAGVALEVQTTNDAMQTLQFKRLVAEHAPKLGRVTVKT